MSWDLKGQTGQSTPLATSLVQTGALKCGWWKMRCTERIKIIWDLNISNIWHVKYLKISFKYVCVCVCVFQQPHKLKALSNCPSTLSTVNRSFRYFPEHNLSSGTFPCFPWLSLWTRLLNFNYISVTFYSPQEIFIKWKNLRNVIDLSSFPPTNFEHELKLDKYANHKNLRARDLSRNSYRKKYVPVAPSKSTWWFLLY